MLDPITLAAISFVVMLILIALGMPVAFATAAIGLIGLIYLVGLEGTGGLLGGLPWSVAANYQLIVIPAFIMKGYFAAYGGITSALYQTARRWLGHLPGGLAIATMWGAALWCTMAGSSSATTVVFGRIAVPEMLKVGYNRRLATGTVAVAAGMAALIPPGSTLIIYAIFTNTSIGRLLAAGLLPGALEVITLSIFVFLIAKRFPDLAPRLPRATWPERWSSIFASGNGLFIVIVLVVFGGLFSGFFTATEAGSVGAILTFILVFFLGGLTMKSASECLMEAARITVALFAIIIGAFLFLHYLAFTGFTAVVTAAIVSLPWPPIVILIGFMVVYLILGSFMESTGMMALTLPLFYPIAQAIGIDGIWMGILVVKMIEIGLIHPPLGMNVYMLKSTLPDVPTHDIFLGAAPFLIVQFINVALILAFPQIALFLPNLFFSK
jgi:tripartite ATP-independent transporter DctM subunit